MRSPLAKPSLTDHPVDIGQRSEEAVLARLVESGYRVLLPFGVNQRYDLVLDNGGELLKAQVKTGRIRDGVVEFIPAEEVPPSGMHLRLVAPHNHQSKRVRWASEYELPA